MQEFDDSIAVALDAEAAKKMKDAGCSVKFLAAFSPAFHNRKSDTWSCCVWQASQPVGTI